MSTPTLEVADIFRAQGSVWRRAHAGHNSLAQLKVMSAIEACRSAALAVDMYCAAPPVGISRSPTTPVVTGPPKVSGVVPHIDRSWWRLLHGWETMDSLQARLLPAGTGAVTTVSALVSGKTEICLSNR